MTGFHGFKPSWLGKLSTLVQVIAVGLILIGVVSGYSFHLPTTYFFVAFLAVLSGVHYIFFVARLMNQEKSTDETS
jgi:phosphatidylglycerophosphate synthase